MVLQFNHTVVIYTSQHIDEYDVGKFIQNASYTFIKCAALFV